MRRKNRMSHEVKWREEIHKKVYLSFIPFCFANALFILPFKYEDQLVNFYVSGICHFVMLITYIGL